MRVLYVNHTSRVSGGELSLLGLLAAPPAGVEATVACPEGELAERLRRAGVEVAPIQGTDGSLRLSPTATPRALAEMARASLQVRRAAARHRADVVHANSIRAGLIATGPSGIGRPPTVVHVRDCLPPGRVSALTLRAIARADALIANSAHTRASLGSAAASARVVHNAVDLARFERVELSPAAARARLGLAPGGPVLGTIAQITPWKGQDDAIRIAAALRQRHPDLRLLLVGAVKFDSASTRHDNAAYLDGLRGLVDELGLGDAVSFLGERDDVPELLAAIDVLLAPSWEEPFGRSIIEAMAAGTAVAATSVGGPPEIVDDGVSGLLLAPREPRLWAQAIETLLDEPGRLEQIAARGRAEAFHRFGAERHATAVGEVYRAVSGVPPSRPVAGRC